jgi:hypothetical protein
LIVNIRRNSFGNLGIPVRRRELGDTWAVTAGSRRGIQVRDRDGEIMPVQVRKRWSPDRGQRRTTFYKVAAKAMGALGIGIGAIDLGALGAGVQMLKFYGESSGWVYSVNRGTTPATIVIVAKPGVGKVSVPVDPSSGAYKAIAKALPTMRQLSMEAFEAQLKTHSAYKKTTTPRPSTPASQAASQVAADTSEASPLQLLREHYHQVWRKRASEAAPSAGEAAGPAYPPIIELYDGTQEALQGELRRAWQECVDIVKAAGVSWRNGYHFHGLESYGIRRPSKYDDQERQLAVWEGGYMALPIEAPGVRQSEMGLMLLCLPDDPIGQKLLACLRSVRCKPYRRRGRKGVHPRIGFLVQGSDGLGVISRQLTDWPLVATNYEGEVLRGVKALAPLFDAEAPPQGRLGIISGPPGTGKTHLIKAICGWSYTGERSTPLLLAPNVATELGTPSFMMWLLSYAERISSGPIRIVIEDADHLIAPRDMNPNGLSALSNFLQVTSGMLGEAVDLRIICSINEWDESRIDPAVTRPGRMLAHVNVPLLSPMGATRCAAALKLPERAYTEPTPLAAIYQDLFAHRALTEKPGKAKKKKEADDGTEEWGEV